MGEGLTGVGAVTVWGEYAAPTVTVTDERDVMTQRGAGTRAPAHSVVGMDGGGKAFVCISL